MTIEELTQLVNETSAELEKAKYDLENTHCPRISYTDIEDVSDRYQERLEYNWWVDDQKQLIHKLEEELASYRDKLDNLLLDNQAEEWIDGWG